MISAALPIGVFDSGIGGLTVLRALRSVMPNESFLYLGDTARLPYGTKTPETICHYALNVCEVLVAKGIKCLVVACNTATSVALEVIKTHFPELQVIGVIEPGARVSLQVESKAPLVVFATESTVKRGAYRETLRALVPDRLVIEWPCQLWVALAEEGWRQGSLVEAIVAETIRPLREMSSELPACYLLGCTHFPILQQALQNVLGETATIVDPAMAVAHAVKYTLEEHALLSGAQHPGSTHFLATDGVERFSRVGEIFLQESIPTQNIELVTVPLRIGGIEHTSPVIETRTRRMGDAMGWERGKG